MVADAVNNFLPLLKVDGPVTTTTQICGHSVFEFGFYVCWLEIIFKTDKAIDMLV